MEEAIKTEEFVMKVSLSRLEFLSVRFWAITLFLLATSNSALANQKGNDQIKTIAIIGNSELPKVEVSLPWRVASDKDVTKIELTPKRMPDALKATDIGEHKQRVYFDRYIKVSTEFFTN